MRIALILGAVVAVLAIASLFLLGSELPADFPRDQVTMSAPKPEAPPPASEAVPEPADLEAIEPASGPEYTGTKDPPPAAHDPEPEPLPPAAAGDPPVSAALPKKNGHSGAKVLSYFQQSITTLDTKRAFGFVLLPRAAVTDEEKRSHKAFCEIMLASMDYMSPGAVAASAPSKVLATYWPIVIGRDAVEIAAAFSARDCNDLIAWYDHALARKLAANAGVADLSGPLLITWPSGEAADAVRDPLIVDFSKADHVRATKALQYWFRQLKSRPELWTNRIREGTIRAELADAVNDTAGVVLAVMSGKWESLKTVANP
jgi:hypothetical protein